MMHARTPSPHRPLLALVTGFTLLIVLGGGALIAATRSGGEPVAASQGSEAPQVPPSSPDAQSVCEERVVDLLYQYGQDAQYSGQVPTLTPDQVATTTLRQRTIYLDVLGDYSLMLTRTDMVQAIQAVHPRVRRGCAQASSSDQ